MVINLKRMAGFLLLFFARKQTDGVTGIIFTCLELFLLASQTVGKEFVYVVELQHEENFMSLFQQPCCP